MSNQHYRKDEPQQPSRLELLIEARTILESAAKSHADGGARVSVLLQTEYKRRGGDQIDMQIEGMILVVEEGKIYRREALHYAAEMERYRNGQRKDAPPRPEPGAISATTMVSATRQFEKLEARREAITEECELTVAALLVAENEKLRPRRRQEPHGEPAEQAASKPAQKKPEEKATTPGKAAATAAA